MPERLLTTGDIAEYCQVSRVTVFQWIKKEQIPAFATQVVDPAPVAVGGQDAREGLHRTL